MLVASAVMISILVGCLARRNTFSSCFVALSVVYIYFFYVVPLLALSDHSGVSYGGVFHSITPEEYRFAVLSLLVFIAGFFCSDFIRRLLRREVYVSEENAFLYPRVEKKPSSSRAVSHGNLSLFFWIVFIIVAAYYALGIMDPQRAEMGYAVRKGEVAGSWMKAIVGVIVGALAYSVLVVAISLKRNAIVWTLAFLVVCFMLTGSSGRSGLIAFFVLLCIYTFRLKVSFVIVLSVPILFIVMPIVISMKGIIYSISVNNEIPSLIDIYFSTARHEGLINNFGHPLLSMLKVDSTVQLVGYRFFYDYIQGFVFYLRVLGLPIGDSLLYFNTESLLGKRASVVPTGYLAFGYVQLGLLGVFWAGVFYRCIGLLAEYIYVRGGFNGEAAKFYFVFMAAATFYHGETRVMVLTFFIPMAIIYLCSLYMVKALPQR